MTTISAKVIADSVNEQGNRLTTVRCLYPRWIHAEVMTHRQFSRNAASSRAIPVKRMIEGIKSHPAVPMFWGSNKPGMQAGEECNASVPYRDGSWDSREDHWLTAMSHAIDAAEAFDRAGYHKQIVNRLLEPFMHIGVLISATEWSNFFALRIHEAAEPHIRLLAERIKAVIDASEPERLQPGEWHTPFVEKGEIYDLDLVLRLSVARCAHLSYETVEGKPLGVDQCDRIYDKLLGSTPIHASPAEHQATPDNPYLGGEAGSRWQRPDEHGNFVGWRQYRKMLPGECL